MHIANLAGNRWAKRILSWHFREKNLLVDPVLFRTRNFKGFWRFKQLGPDIVGYKPSAMVTAKQCICRVCPAAPLECTYVVIVYFVHPPVLQKGPPVGVQA